MPNRLLVDLTRCEACEECSVQCGRQYTPRLAHQGILTLRELAYFALLCRRCEQPNCVAACKFEALERQPDGVMKRYNLRCVSCKSCAHACPFGTIYPDTLPYFVIPCELCRGQNPGKEPLCLSSCCKQAIQLTEQEPNEAQGVFALGEHLLVRAPRWVKQAV